MALFIEQHQVALSLFLLFGIFIGFALDRIPASGVAVIGAAAFLAFGFVTRENALAVFSNDAALTVAAMLVLSAALVGTGTLEAISGKILLLVRVSPMSAIALLLGMALVGSAFMNSTPIVAIMIPLAMTLANALGITPKRLLIPLSYMAILGGTCTLLGTSTNLIVNGLAVQAGLPSFGIFEITLIGLISAVTGALFLALFGKHLLPSEIAPGGAALEEKSDILTTVKIRDGFPEVGKPYADVDLFAPRGVKLVSVTRGAATLDAHDPETVVTLGDRVTLRVTSKELATLLPKPELEMGTRVRIESNEEKVVKRATIGVGCQAVGKRIQEADFMSRHPVTTLGVRRRQNLAGPDFRSLRYKAGDQVWLHGSEEVLAAVASDASLIFSNTPAAKPFKRGHATLAIGTLATIVLTAAFGWLPLVVAAFLGIALLLVTGGLDTEDAWEAVNLDVLILIFAMLIVGTGLQNTGAVDAVVNGSMPMLRALSPIGVIVVIYALTSCLTEVVTNNGVAVIMTPMAIGLAEPLEIPARALVLTVMLASSASFATPIGYQTNTLVHVAGQYTFAEFMRIGVPMNLVVGAASCGTLWAIYLR
ncbi:Citrate transporter [Planctomycetes bacterium Poly30]|uniref:Citrate transporter n=1 Tax=Saltatorellus ferox TaxID=2528018 RepID=A0A518EYJ8_9BACT|nr:Citrate transporter [Planctomycetes bacterium Poly30]